MNRKERTLVARLRAKGATEEEIKEALDRMIPMWRSTDAYKVKSKKAQGTPS